MGAKDFSGGACGIITCTRVDLRRPALWIRIKETSVGTVG